MFKTLNDRYEIEHGNFLVHAKGLSLQRSFIKDEKENRRFFTDILAKGILQDGLETSNYNKEILKEVDLKIVSDENAKLEWALKRDQCDLIDDIKNADEREQRVRKSLTEDFDRLPPTANLWAPWLTCKLPSDVFLRLLADIESKKVFDLHFTIKWRFSYSRRDNETNQKIWSSMTLGEKDIYQGLNGYVEGCLWKFL